ncbi:Uncharacterized protein OS=Singulisphaera acidiphila (strain ATCC BAA-1392 / DSM 18658 / VKM B-2454 / MOB10) GN=Sinac_5986 PE=4 SV=1: PSCyt2: PSD1 [Gemmataceae bacterium]|nr:Uncharacterized protein OS=Singulisphaera acidiphila (strain ATCC BAA-1392 / DSM 18658 / VKM B-2454 / MOB10) GN=Sinac_5986 PE=4 SV=1: PSCyt2: PSD1 [Gemmataceae bacterium]VTT96616.1 Uncharacterized protein OS=Singulisphaera acidiphila (strain ATCC BAA-1392 / DSM 18658 / VKM B-2454 / MOB10) GN=Sinac_5986 PE=4 SV=1: PSCyt2: PSD1 [Gemmataceae bacterium]
MFSTRFLFALAVCIASPVAASAQVALPTGGTLPAVDFERHVMGLLSKVGCNSGSCHGSFQGKGGFRLSLFGYEPGIDHAGLTRDNLGRRLNAVKPDESLLLQKATGQTYHDGGMRFGKDSWVYGVFREWVRAGAKWTPGSGAIEKLEVTPKDFALLAGEKPLQVKVTATFADGTSEDITPFCDFRITDDAIAALSPLGQLTPRQPGDAGLTVLYRGSVRAIRVLVPTPPQAGGYPKVPEVNYVDREVFAKLKMLNVVPSDLAGDATFLRRVTIDTIGQLPTPEELREFLADKDPKKREKAIDRLLAHPLHAAVWATKLSDVTGNNTQALEQPQPTQPRRSQMWHDWLRKRIADNVPYDQMVRDIVTATSRDGQTPAEWLEYAKKIDAQSEKSFATDYPEKKTLDLFWRRQAQVPIEQWGEKVAVAFLGVRLECAQCHKHPTDRWTQDEYWAFANLFSQVTFVNNQFSTPELKKLVDEENKLRKENAPKANNNNVLVVREMFVSPAARGAKPNPATGRAPTPKALGGPEIPVKPGEDARVKLAEWMTAPENPFFAKSFANRVWAHYFGTGLVNPVDDFSLANPPTNARLLDALAEAFVKSKYDVRKLEKDVLMSRTYQLDYATNPTNAFDKNNFSHAYVRPMMAEQVVDVLNAALGVGETYTGPDEPLTGKKIVEVGSSRVQNPNLAYALRIFGRPPRTTACDCERAAEPALPQTLFRMTDASILAKFTDKKGRVAALAASKLTPEELAEELFLATLSRLPTAEQKADAAEAIKTAKTRAEGITDVMWALVNTREFILNH